MLKQPLLPEGEDANNDGDSQALVTVSRDGGEDGTSTFRGPNSSLARGDEIFDTLGARPIGDPDAEAEYLQKALSLNREALHKYWRSSMANQPDCQDPNALDDCPAFSNAWTKCQSLLEYQEELRADLDKVYARQHQAREFLELFGPANYGFAPLPEGHVSKAGGLFRRVYCRQYFRDGIMYREKGERKVAWSELFFDLAFAVMVNTIGVTLEEHVTQAQAVRMQVVFMAVYRQWIRAQTFINVYDNDDLFMKLYYLLQIVAVIGVGSFLTAYGADQTAGMTLAYLVSLLAAFMVRLRVLAQDRTMSTNATLVGLQDVVFILTICPAIFVSHSTLHPLWFWGFALIIDTMIISWLTVRETPAYNIEHMQERFGLFQVLVYAERLVAMFFHGAGITAVGVIAILCGVASTIAMQTLYFEVLHGPGKLAKHALRRRTWRQVPFFLVHAVLACATVFSGPGMKLLMESAIPILSSECVAGDIVTELGTTHASKKAYIILFCFSEAVSMMCLTLLAVIHKLKMRSDMNVSPLKRVWGRALLAVIIACLPILGNSIPGYTYIIVSGLLVTAWTVFDLWGSLKYKGDGAITEAHH